MAPDLDSIRTRLSTDHAVIRGLMQALAAAAKGSERDPSMCALAHDIVEQLSEELERHFAYEATLLSPLSLDPAALSSPGLRTPCVRPR